MNLNSLPDELLASIFKYSNYESITGMRKLDRRIDRIAKRYGINKVAVSNAKVYLSTDEGYIELICSKSIWNVCGFESSSDTEARKIRLNKGQELEEVCAILAKIKIEGEFLVQIYDKVELGDNWINMFCRQKHSFRTFCLDNFDYEADYHCTRSSMRNFVKMCSKMREIKFHGPSSQYDMFNSEVLGSRNWDRLNLNLNGDRGTTVKVMDSQFLNNVVSKCKTFNMGGKVVFEIQDILDMIAKNLLDKTFDHQMWLFPNVSAGQFTLREMVRRMICLDGIKVEINQNESHSNSAACKITIPSKPNVTILLLLKGESAEEIKELIAMTTPKVN